MCVITGEVHHTTACPLIAGTAARWRRVPWDASRNTRTGQSPRCAAVRLNSVTLDPRLSPLSQLTDRLLLPTPNLPLWVTVSLPRSQLSYSGCLSNILSPDFTVINSNAHTVGWWSEYISTRYSRSEYRLPTTRTITGGTQVTSRLLNV